MNQDDRRIERWHFGDRFYGVMLASTPDGMDLELDDLGAALERRTMMIASYADATGDMTLRVFTDERLPLALIEQFVSEARLRLPPSSELP